MAVGRWGKEHFQTNDEGMGWLCQKWVSVNNVHVVISLYRRATGIGMSTAIGKAVDSGVHVNEVNL